MAKPAQLLQDERAQDVKPDLQVAPNFPGGPRLKPRLPTRTPSAAVLRGAVAYQKDADHHGAMVALRLPVFAARQVAIPGGEAPEDLHCTLAYLGDAADLTATQLSRLREALGRVCATTPPLEGQIQGYGRFRVSGGDDGDDAAAQDVIWTTLDSPDLPDLRHRVVQACRDAGVEPAGDHGFTPHVTLAYVDPGEGEDSMPPAVEVKFKYLSLCVGGREEAIELERGESDSSSEKPQPAGEPQTFSVLQEPLRENFRNQEQLDEWAQDRGALIVRADVPARPCVVVKKGSDVVIAVEGVPAGEPVRLDDLVTALRRIDHDCILYGWLGAKSLEGRWLADDELPSVLSGDSVATPTFLGCDVLALDGDLTDRTALDRMELLRAVLGVVGGHAMVPLQVVCEAGQDVEECVDQAMSWRPSEGAGLEPIGVTVVDASSTYTHGPTDDEVRLDLRTAKAWSDEARAAALAARRAHMAPDPPAFGTAPTVAEAPAESEKIAAMPLPRSEYSGFLNPDGSFRLAAGGAEHATLMRNDERYDSMRASGHVRFWSSPGAVGVDYGPRANMTHVAQLLDKAGSRKVYLDDDEAGYEFRDGFGAAAAVRSGDVRGWIRENGAARVVTKSELAEVLKEYGFGAGPGPGEPPDWRTKIPKEKPREPNFLQPEKSADGVPDGDGNPQHLPKNFMHRVAGPVGDAHDPPAGWVPDLGFTGPVLPTDKDAAGGAAAPGVFGTPGAAGIIAPQQGMFKKPRRKAAFECPSCGMGWPSESEIERHDDVCPRCGASQVGIKLKDENATAGVAIIPVSTRPKKPTSQGVDGDAPEWPGYATPDMKAALVEKYITHEGSRWHVHAESGKVLGTHGSKADAVAQLRAVEWHKAHPTAKALSQGAGDGDSFSVGPGVVGAHRFVVGRLVDGEFVHDPDHERVNPYEAIFQRKGVVLKAWSDAARAAAAEARRRNAGARDRTPEEAAHDKEVADEAARRYGGPRKTPAGMRRLKGLDDLAFDREGTSGFVNPDGTVRAINGMQEHATILGNDESAYELLQNGGVRFWVDDGRPGAGGVDYDQAEGETDKETVARLCEKMGARQVWLDRNDGKSWTFRDGHAAAKAVRDDFKKVPFMEGRVLKGDVSPSNLPADPRPHKWPSLGGDVRKESMDSRKPRKYPDVGEDMGFNDTYDAKSAEEREQRERDRMAMVGAPVSKFCFPYEDLQKAWSDAAREAALEARRRNKKPDRPEQAGPRMGPGAEARKTSWRDLSHGKFWVAPSGDAYQAESGSDDNHFALAAEILEGGPDEPAGADDAFYKLKDAGYVRGQLTFAGGPDEDSEDIQMDLDVGPKADPKMAAALLRQVRPDEVNVDRSGSDTDSDNISALKTSKHFHGRGAWGKAAEWLESDTRGVAKPKKSVGVMWEVEEPARPATVVNGYGDRGAGKVRLGKCYQQAGYFAMDYRGVTVVHGTVSIGQAKSADGAGIAIAHAWVELSDGFVYDGVQDRFYDKASYYEKMRAVAEQRYTGQEACEKMLERKTFGPWGPTAGMQK